MIGKLMVERYNTIPSLPVDPSRPHRNRLRSILKERNVPRSAIDQPAHEAANDIHVIEPLQKIGAGEFRAAAKVCCHRLCCAIRQLPERGGVEKGPLLERWKFFPYPQPIGH